MAEKIAIRLLDADTSSYDKCLGDLLKKHVNNRNLAVHNLFMVSETSDNQYSVEFMHVVARKELTFPNIKWSHKDFIDKTEAIWSCYSILREIEEKVSKVDNSAANRHLSDMTLLAEHYLAASESANLDTTTMNE